MMSKLANKATAGFRRGFRPVDTFGSVEPGCTPSYTPPRKPSFLSRSHPRNWSPVVRVRVDGRLVRAAGDGEAGVRIEDQSALDQQDVVALGAERTPCNPGVLDDHPAGVVAELTEVRVVDLEVIGKVAAYVAVHLKAGPAHEEIVAGVGSVRAPVLVDLHLGLDEDLEVERRVFRR